MEHESFSIGYGDCILGKENRDINKEIIEKYIKKANDVLMEAYEGVYKPELDRVYVRESIEQEMQSILNDCSEEIKKNTMANINGNNMFYQIIDSGSKGGNDNLQQILGTVGQQTIWGKRGSDGFTDRVLPHFTRFDIGPDAKDFAEIHFQKEWLQMNIIFTLLRVVLVLLIRQLKQPVLVIFQENLLKLTEDLSTIR